MMVPMTSLSSVYFKPGEHFEHTKKTTIMPKKMSESVSLEGDQYTSESGVVGQSVTRILQQYGNSASHGPVNQIIEICNRCHRKYKKMKDEVYTAEQEGQLHVLDQMAKNRLVQQIKVLFNRELKHFFKDMQYLRNTDTKLKEVIQK